MWAEIHSAGWVRSMKIPGESGEIDWGRGRMVPRENSLYNVKAVEGEGEEAPRGGGYE